MVDSKIEGPIAVCEKVFSKTKLCNYLDNIGDAGELVDNYLHGERVSADPRLSKIYQ